MDAGGDLGALKAMAYPGTGRSVEAELTQLIAVIGENLSLRRTITISVTKGVMGSYVHNQTAPGLGKIGVLVALESGADTANLSGLGKQLAMHIAATSPQAVDTADLDPAAVERERKILAEQARASGKPEEIIEKMVEGRLRKFYEEVCLLEQTYVIDGESKVRKALDAASSELGGAIKVSAFVRYQVGEGIDRGPDDFAAEVAAQLR
jgi:elongation factor Ts